MYLSHLGTSISISEHWEPNICAASCPGRLCNLPINTRNLESGLKYSLKPYKTLFINTQLIPKMYKSTRKKGEFKGREVSTN
jgi:hypothetical protein